MNFKQLCQQTVHNRSRNTAGESISWLRIKHLRFDKALPHTVQYKYALSADEFMELNVQDRRRRGRRSHTNESLEPVYKSRLAISAAKKKDLLKLVKDRVIPPEYSDWYGSLPVSDSVPDCLQSPSADEPEPDELDE